MNRFVGCAIVLFLAAGIARGMPVGYTMCAHEGGTCSVPSSNASVAYGWQDSYNYLTVTSGSIACNSTVFGDPLPGVGKSCFYKLNITTGTPTTDAASINTARAKGISWLIAHQRGDGSWMDAGNLQTHATASALEAFAAVGMQGSVPAGATTSWLLNNDATSTDSLARTVRALRAVGADASVSLRALERNRSNLYFGSYRGYAVSMPDTALGIDALVAAGKLTFSTSELAKASSIFTDEFRNGDGGWAYVPYATAGTSDLSAAMSRKSGILPTTLLMQAFVRYAMASGDAGFKGGARGYIHRGIEYLKSVQKTDGGFADDADLNAAASLSAPSQAYESALVRQTLEVVKAIGLDSSHGADAQGMIDGAQLFLLKEQQKSANGSWNNDPLATAMALASFPANTLPDTDGDGLPDLVEQNYCPADCNPAVADSNIHLYGPGYLSNGTYVGATSRAVNISVLRNTYFSYQPELMGATAPYNFQLISSLPPGVLFNYTNGSIYGGVIVPGDYPVRMTMRDAKNVTFEYVGWLHVTAVTTLDSDGDGMPDWWEFKYDLNPYSPTDASTDADGDGLTNLQEFQRGTNPLNADTDGDGMSDGAEVAAGRNPLINEEKARKAAILIIMQLLDD